MISIYIKHTERQRDAYRRRDGKRERAKERAKEREIFREREREKGGGTIYQACTSIEDSWMAGMASLKTM